MYTVLHFSMAFILIVGGAGRAHTIAVTYPQFTFTIYQSASLFAFFISRTITVANSCCKFTVTSCKLAASETQEENLFSLILNLMIGQGYEDLFTSGKR